MRLFIAVNFDDEVKNHIQRIQDELRKEATGNFSRRENFHLTLAFLGEQGEDEADMVKRIMQTLTVKPMTLVFTKTGCFKRPQGDVWWLGLEKNEQLFSLQQELADKLRRFSFDLEDRPYSPHITLARKVRLRPQSKPPLLKEKFSATTEHVSLMLSHRVDGKLTYTEIFRV
ncbi:MAG: RNA 2',3'-cyclic phosphodiesterase [Firmicutes bacterium]|nr:RNA 2',3'-cyclic phosphodiesterase [Bacillota bacterium]